VDADSKGPNHRVTISVAEALDLHADLVPPPLDAGDVHPRPIRQGSIAANARGLKTPRSARRNRVCAGGSVLISWGAAGSPAR
jgi:hypothetical protein